MRGHVARRTVHEMLDGHLDDAGRDAVLRHVERCDRCRRRLEDVETFRGRLDALRGPREPRRELWEGIERRIRAASPRNGPTGVRSALPGPRRHALIAAAAVALVAAMGLALLVWPGDSSRRSAGPGEVRPADQGAGLIGLEREYGPIIDRLNRLVEERSRELEFDLVSSAEADLAMIRASRQEIRHALRDAAGDAGLLAQLEQRYRSEVRYLERLASVESF